ncbi:polysaccharide pyruvyl transferase family protein [Virgibacillus dokdonensis]|uniref:Polysaccharide pyruvyl transferase n=1 Tax=Virgibacillus dokdonensis TaxID=302167 RepID=A0A2K9IW49_9BACI|nr:polysaccharide pyruvyl transferase family protein [Virgibacillus dokdonensis]AUJ23979.1 Polysaccharide pyruvyl transferase [Virgibacillus dokdonensis]
MKIGLVYGHVASNLGDLCINKGVVSLIESISPDSKLNVVLKNPNPNYLEVAKKSFEGTMKINFIEFQPPKNVYDEYQSLKEYLEDPKEFLIDTNLYDCDVIVNNAGEFLFSYKDNPRLDFIWRTLPSIAAKSEGIKFVTLPSTLGPFQDVEGKNLITSFLTCNATIGVRDNESMNLLSKIVGGHPQPQSLLDPAFFIKKNRIQLKEKFEKPRLGMIMRLDDFGLRTGGKKSSVNYRISKQNNFKNSLSYIFSIKVIEDFLNKFGGIVDLFIQTKYDDELVKTIFNHWKFKGYDKYVNVIYPTNIDDYLEAISHCNYVISSRFHGCILSFLAGVPAIGVYFNSHGHKMPGLYKMLNVSDSCFKINNTNISLISKLIISNYNSKSKLMEQVNNKIEMLKIKTKNWAEKELFSSYTVNEELNQIDILNFMEYLEKFRLSSIADTKKEINVVRKIEYELECLKENQYAIESQLEKIHTKQNFIKEKLTEIEGNSKNNFDNIQNQLVTLQKNINEILSHDNRKIYEKFLRKLTKLSFPKRIFSLKLNMDNKKTKLISFVANKNKYLIWNLDELIYDLPDYCNAYISSHSHFNFDIPSDENLIVLEPNTRYQISGELLYEGVNVNLWLIEYDNLKRLENHKYSLKSGLFYKEFVTNKEHVKMSIAIQIYGKGKLFSPTKSWNIE